MGRARVCVVCDGRVTWVVHLYVFVCDGRVTWVVRVYVLCVCVVCMCSMVLLDTLIKISKVHIEQSLSTTLSSLCPQH